MFEYDNDILRRKSFLKIGQDILNVLYNNAVQVYSQDKKCFVYYCSL